MILQMETATGLVVILRTAHGSGLTSQASTMKMHTVLAQVGAFSKMVTVMDKAGLVLTAVNQVQVMNIPLFVSK